MTVKVTIKNDGNKQISVFCRDLFKTVKEWVPLDPSRGYIINPGEEEIFFIWNERDLVIKEKEVVNDL